MTASNLNMHHGITVLYKKVKIIVKCLYLEERELSNRRRNDLCKVNGPLYTLITTVKVII